MLQFKEGNRVKLIWDKVIGKVLHVIENCSCCEKNRYYVRFSDGDENWFEEEDLELAPKKERQPSEEEKIGRSNIVLLKRISEHFKNVNYEELTERETKIVNKLLQAEFLIKVSNILNVK